MSLNTVLETLGILPRRDVARQAAIPQGGELPPIAGDPAVPTPGDNIVVTAPPRNMESRVDTEGAEPPFLGNRRFLEEVQYAADAAPPRTGLFGVRGTLRDVLGTVGDAFLIQGGANPMYRPQRERELLSDAMVGFTNSDEDALAAIERVANQNPEAALNLWNNFRTAQSTSQEAERDAEAAAIEAKRDSAETSREAYNEGVRLISQVAGSSTAQNWGQTRNLMRSIAQRYGLGDEWQIPEQFDPALMDSYRTAGTPATNQQTISISRQNAATAQQRADAYDRSVDRPRPAPAPSNPTAASIAEPLLRRLQNGERLTPGELETLDRSGYDLPAPASRRATRNRALPPGVTVRARN